MTGLDASELAGVATLLRSAGAETVGPLRCELIAGGRSNLTFRLDDGASTWVLRMPPRSGRTPSAHDVAREYRVTRALTGSEVPVPPAVLLHEDEALLGAPFAISGFVEGRGVQSRAELDAVSGRAVAATVSALVETLAALHRVDHTAVGLERFGRPDGYAERQLRRWSAQWEVVGLGLAEDVRRAAAALADQLSRRLPVQQATGIVHGDYRIDNTLLRFGHDDTVRVAAVVDWELSTIGDPAADVALMCVYRDPAFDRVIGAPTAWTSDRFPDADGLAAAYEGAGGVPLVDWDAHLALACFKVAVIAAGIEHRRAAGAGEGAGFDTAAEAVAPYLERGLAHVRGCDVSPRGG